MKKVIDTLINNLYKKGKREGSIQTIEQLYSIIDSKIQRHGIVEYYNKYRSTKYVMWLHIIDKYLDVLNMLDRSNDRVLPNIENIFKVFEYTTPREFRVVLIGNTPYKQIDSNGVMKCTGYAFDVNKDYQGDTKELDEIIECIINDGFSCTSNDISTWISKGIMLLNSSLTVSIEGNEHDIYWNNLIIDVINYINTINKGSTIFVSFGSKASKVLNSSKVNNDNKLHLYHPCTYLYNGDDKLKLTNKHIFNTINEMFNSKSRTSIDWSL